MVAAEYCVKSCHVPPQLREVSITNLSACVAEFLA